MADSSAAYESLGLVCLIQLLKFRHSSSISRFEGWAYSYPLLSRSRLHRWTPVGPSHGMGEEGAQCWWALTRSLGQLSLHLLHICKTNGQVLCFKLYQNEIHVTFKANIISSVNWCLNTCINSSVICKTSHAAAQTLGCIFLETVKSGFCMVLSS